MDTPTRTTGVAISSKIPNTAMAVPLNALNPVANPAKLCGTAPLGYTKC